MDTEHLLRQARNAAWELRTAGERPLPLAEALDLSEPTRRLLEALVGLGIIHRDDVPGLGSPASHAPAA